MLGAPNKAGVAVYSEYDEILFRLGAFLVSDVPDESLFIADVKRTSEIIFPSLDKFGEAITSRKRVYNKDAITYFQNHGAGRIFSSCQRHHFIDSTASTELNMIVQYFSQFHLEKGGEVKPPKDKSRKQYLPEELDILKQRIKLKSDELEDCFESWPSLCADIETHIQSTGHDLWGENDLPNRKRIDTALSKIIYYHNKKEKIPICLCCYGRFENGLVPAKSHILSYWYIRNIYGADYVTPKPGFGREGELDTVSAERMTLFMLCQECDGAQGCLETLLKHHDKAFAALNSLRWEQCMPGDKMLYAGALGRHYNFLEYGDNLEHSIMYKFMICVLMRQLGSQLYRAEFSTLWDLFDCLRSEVHRASGVRNVTSVAFPHNLYLYAIPIGCDIELHTRQFLSQHFLMGDSNSTNIAHVQTYNDVPYLCDRVPPFIWVAGLESLNELRRYRVHNTSDPLVLSMKLDPDEFSGILQRVIIGCLLYAPDVIELNILLEANGTAASHRNAAEKLAFKKRKKFVMDCLNKNISLWQNNPEAIRTFLVLCDTFIREGNEEKYVYCLCTFNGMSDRNVALLPFENMKEFALFMSGRIREMYPTLVVEKQLDSLKRCMQQTSLFAISVTCIPGWGRYFDECVTFEMKQYMSYVYRLRVFFMQDTKYKFPQLRMT